MFTTGALYFQTRSTQYVLQKNAHIVKIFKTFHCLECKNIQNTVAFKLPELEPWNISRMLYRLSCLVTDVRWITNVTIYKFTITEIQL